MSEEMTQHVLSALVDQIPEEHLPHVHTLIELRLGWQSLYIIDAGMGCFQHEITDRVESTLSEIGKWTQENQEHWENVCSREWIKRFSDPGANIYDYGEALTDSTQMEIHENVREAFVDSEDVHDLMRDTILKHYGVQTDGI